MMDAQEQATTVERDVVTMICPNLACRQTVAAPASARGQSVRCAYCNTPFRVPIAGVSHSRVRE